MRFPMRLLTSSVLAALLVLPALARADEPSPVQHEYAASIDDAGGKLIELAEAVPQSRYTWRPGKDVRSFAEVFTHLVVANYAIPMFLGVPLPADAPVTQSNMGTFEKSTTDKARIVAALKASIAHSRQAVLSVPASELDTHVKLFGGMDVTKRAGLLIVVNHQHEHLGQSIAYARMNKVVPPWTAREQAAAKKAAEQKAKSESH